MGYHASGRSAAVFIKDYGNKIIKTLNYASSDYLQKAHGGVLSHRGLLLLGSEDDRDHFTKDSNNLGLMRISVEEAKLKFPMLRSNVTQYAAYKDDVYDLDTDRLQQIFLKESRQTDAFIKTNAEVTNICFRNK